MDNAEIAKAITENGAYMECELLKSIVRVHAYSKDKKLMYNYYINTFYHGGPYNLFNELIQYKQSLQKAANEIDKYSKISEHMQRHCNINGLRYVTFVWENEKIKISEKEIKWFKSDYYKNLLLKIRKAKRKEYREYIESNKKMEIESEKRKIESKWGITV